MMDDIKRQPLDFGLTTFDRNIKNVAGLNMFVGNQSAIKRKLHL